MKFLKWFLLIVLFLVILGGGGAFLYLQSSRPVYSGEIHTPKVNEPVKVYFDHYGIPHIFAANEKDAYFTLGYIQAQERLFQMEMLRRVGSGRLSEILGKDLVKIDAFFRTLGINVKAKESAAKYFTNANEPWQKDALAYLEGVNYFVENGPTPPEFYLIGIPKNKFTPEDIYLITGYMSFSFAEALRTDPILEKINSKYGERYLQSLAVNHVPGTLTNTIHHDSTLAINTNISSFTDELINKLPVGCWLGSNGWVLSPQRSASGKVLLENDTHIGYQQPQVWYEAHINYPGLDLYGNYLAGFPYPLIGHSRMAAWGMTMFENDDMNLYSETVSSKDKDSYQYKGHNLKMESREEIIHVKDSKDTIIYVRSTVHGPIVNDVIDSVGTQPVSLFWTYTQSTSTALEATYMLSRATGIKEARHAASMVEAPGLNIMYGDSSGNIAWWASAKLPVYRKGLNTKLFLDGASGNDDILGYLPFDQNPMSENPESGVVYSANNQPDSISGMMYPGYYAPEDRGLRIKTLLAEKEKWTLKELEKVNTDVVSTKQPENIKIILSALKNNKCLTRSPLHMKIAQKLQNWNGSHELMNIAPTIYYNLLSYIFDFSMKDELGEKDYNTLVNTHLMKSSYSLFLADDSSSWWDNIHTKDKKELREEIIAAAFDSTVNSLQQKLGENMSNWTWGSVHTLEHVHPIGRKEPFNQVFNVGPFQVPGGIETINNAGFPLNTEGRFKVSYGPAMRILIDFNNLNRSKSISPTGQSGHVMSQYYHDQALLFNAGGNRDMLMDRYYIEKVCTNILTFIPN